MGFQLTNELKLRLFNEHKDYVFRTTLIITQSKTLADDVVQEVFIRVFDKYHTYNNQKPIKPWIYKITMNVARNLFRVNFLKKWYS